ncbi:hypothetical protein PDE_04612 [Penicillium oxalicum 114-2]|uniref:Uncharacterized protein n=1 Tax=Penicillium oxalicum (strain 114-2 / CGMCC 5302) TaxID=933388 RepID=S8B516_PENO1|nr:hypothetical protein PDE_04612 [Penicillium oxalicum 114-2]
MFRNQLLQCLMVSLSLWSLALAANPRVTDRAMHHESQSLQDALASINANSFHEALHVLSRRFQHGIFETDMSAAEVMQREDERIATLVSLAKRDGNSTASPVTVTSQEPTTSPDPVTSPVPITTSIAPTEAPTTSLAPVTTAQPTTVVAPTTSEPTPIVEPTTTKAETTSSSTSTTSSSTSSQAPTTQAPLPTTSTKSSEPSTSSSEEVLPTTSVSSTTQSTLSTTTSRPPSSSSTSSETTDSSFTTTFKSTSTKPDGSLTTLTSTAIVHVRPTGASAQSATKAGAAPGLQTTGAAVMNTANRSWEVMAMVWGAIMAAMAL